MNQVPRSILVPSALLAGLLPLVANSLYSDEFSSGAELLQAASAKQSMAESVSLGLFLVGFVAFIALVAVLAAAISTSSPALAGIAGIAGAAAVAVKLAEAQTGAALSTSGEALSPAVAETLYARDEAGFVVYGFLSSLALFAVGLGLLRGGFGPRWQVWAPIVLGALGVLAAGLGIVFTGSYMPIPYLLLLLWMIILGIATARRPLATMSA